jgi:peroxiredoxin
VRRKRRGGNPSAGDGGVGEARDAAYGKTRAAEIQAPVSAAAIPGARAPDFNLPLVGGGYRGLRDLLEPGGGVLVFFKEDCPASELVVPRLAPLAAALEMEERFFLAIAEDLEETALAFRERHGIRFPIAWQAAPYATSAAYAITTVPALFVIDGTGIIAERVEGFIKSEYLALGAGIEQALAMGAAPPILHRPEDLPQLRPG